MNNRLATWVAALAVILVANLFLFGQTTGSIAGTVTDSNGAVVAGAQVTAVGPSGVEYTAVTSDSGIFRIPALGTGLYKVTITAKNFKKIVVENVKVDVGLPATVNSTMEVGGVDETITVTTGGEVLQTATATIGTTIQGRQILETPIASRDALDLVGMLPGTASVGAPRRSSINGLPKGALSITIDGVDVQDNTLRSSDGYFTYVRPRIDAIEEVTVSTSNPGSETGGDGAVQVRFVTRRGSNDYRGSAFYQHRNNALNSAYWFNNRDLAGPDTRNIMKLNQYGVNFGGPIPFPRFGDRGGPFWDSGKDKAYFFINWEEFRIPASQTRTRQVLTTDAQAGLFRYNVASVPGSLPAWCTAVSGTQVQCNVFQIAQAAACATCLTTPDPLVGTTLADIRAAVGTAGSLAPRPNAPNLQDYTFTPSGNSPRKFLALRFDVNVTKNHSVEFVTNQQQFVPSKDFLNSQDERFPGYPWYTQGSNRDSYSMAVRSNFGRNVVNEARYAISTGLSTFSEGIGLADFAFTGGYVLGIDAAGATTPYSRNSYSDRNVPTYDFTDSVTWINGNHSINFGGQYKVIKSNVGSQTRIAPSVAFGLLSADPAFAAFTSRLPGASSAQITEARNLYATLIGRITSYTSQAVLTADNTYQQDDLLTRLSEQRTYGLFVQDSWRAHPTLTLNFGIRWQPQGAFVAMSDSVFTKLESYDQIYGISGAGNIFKPGVLTGSNPRVIPLAIGEKAYPDDMDNFAPSVGVVWSPNFGDSGILRTLFGAPGKSVFRGGYSVAYVREGFDLLASILGANPGGTLSLTRSSTTFAGSFVTGTNLRDPNNPNLRPNTFSNGSPIIGSGPSFPIALTTSDATNAFSPDLKTGKVNSYSFGYQRELDSNTVVEVRYVGNRGIDLQRQYNINEFNTIENGFAAEFLLAQANLYSNIACAATPGCTGGGNHFGYRGAGTGTSPLPIMLSYFGNFSATPGGVAAASLVPANYAAANFGNTTLVTSLSRNGPSFAAWTGSSFENDATRRNNALLNGRPANFFYVNPTTGVNGSWTVDNSNLTWYDSGVIELRRRLSNGLRVQASYVFSKAQANAYASSSVVAANFTQREGGLELAKNVQAFDIRHQFKFDATWDLPFGRGRQFGSSANAWVNAFIGGWTLLPTVRWQSGSPFSLGNVQLVGMDRKELQKMVGVYKDTILPSGQQVVTYLPLDIILNTQRAFDLSPTNTGNNGYGTNFGSGGPQGKFVAPAGYGNCISTYGGKCGFNNLILYGPSFFKLDMTLAKKFALGEKRSIELRAMFLDALNRPNWRVGGWGADTAAVTAGNSTFGQLASGSAYQDISTTNDPGGRLIDLMLRIYF